MRYLVLAVLVSVPLSFAGCAGLSDEQAYEATNEYREGPKVRPDDLKWRRKALPLPPVYMSYTSGSGNRWKMITPFYWQMDGRDRSRKTLIPLMTAGEDRVAKRKSGYFLNWIWSESPESGHRVLFPFYWNFRSEESDTSVYGPLYVRAEHDGKQRRRLIFFPWIYSRETDATGYDYWGVLFRLVGYEKEVIDGRRRERLWLFFVFTIDTV
jgi:hypothetical protein